MLVSLWGVAGTQYWGAAEQVGRASYVHLPRWQWLNAGTIGRRNNKHASLPLCRDGVMPALEELPTVNRNGGAAGRSAGLYRI